MLEFNIDGKLYWCIKSFYENNLSCIRLSPSITTELFDQVLPLNWDYFQYNDNNWSSDMKNLCEQFELDIYESKQPVSTLLVK